MIVMFQASDEAIFQQGEVFWLREILPRTEVSLRRGLSGSWAIPCSLVGSGVSSGLPRIPCNVFVTDRERGQVSRWEHTNRGSVGCKKIQDAGSVSPTV